MDRFKIGQVEEKAPARWNGRVKRTDQRLTTDAISRALELAYVPKRRRR